MKIKDYRRRLVAKLKIWSEWYSEWAHKSSVLELPIIGDIAQLKKRDTESGYSA